MESKIKNKKNLCDLFQQITKCNGKGQVETNMTTETVLLEDMLMD